jgi:hypothetical protein
VVVVHNHDWQIVGGANGTRRYRCSRCKQDRLSGQRTMRLPLGPCSGSVAEGGRKTDKDEPSVA